MIQTLLLQLEHRLRYEVLNALNLLRHYNMILEYVPEGKYLKDSLVDMSDEVKTTRFLILAASIRMSSKSA